MKKTITLLIAILTTTACMAPMDDDDMDGANDANDAAEVGESGDALSRTLSYRNGDPCTVDDNGTDRQGSRDGGFCCYENGRGNEECINCFFHTCTDGWNVLGGGWGAPILDRIGF